MSTLQPGVYRIELSSGVYTLVVSTHHNAGKKSYLPTHVVICPKGSVKCWEKDAIKNANYDWTPVWTPNEDSSK